MPNSKKKKKEKEEEEGEQKNITLEINPTIDKAYSKYFDTPLYSVKIIHMTSRTLVGPQDFYFEVRSVKRPFVFIFSSLFLFSFLFTSVFCNIY